MALARPRRRPRQGSSRRRRPADSRRPKPSPRTATSSPCAGCAAQGPGPAGPEEAPAPGKAPGVAGPDWARAPARPAGRAVPDELQMRPPQRQRAGPPPDVGAEARNRTQAATEAAAAARCSEGCGYRRGSCHRRSGVAAAAARRGLLAGTAPLSAAGPAHCRHRPRPSIAPPTRLLRRFSCPRRGLKTRNAGPRPPARPRPLPGSAPTSAPMTGCLQLWLRPGALDHASPAGSCCHARLEFFARRLGPPSCIRLAVSWSRRRASPAS